MSDERPHEIDDATARHALQELRVHQIELEMQNDELRRAQAALDVAHAEYRDLFEFAPVGYLIVDEAGIITKANLRAAAMLGADRGTLIRSPIVRLIVADDQDVYYHHRRGLLEPGAVDRCELRMLRPDAALLWVELHSTLVWSAAGMPVNRIALTDVTLRKATQRALEQSEARSTAITQSAHDAIITTDREGRIVGWNAGAATMFGTPEQVALGQTATEFMTPSGPREGILGRHTDGTTFPVEQSIATWETGDGQFSTRIVRDVSERERTATLLRLQGAALAASANAIMITDSKGVVEWINPAVAALSGYAVHDVIGKRPSEMPDTGTDGVSFYARLQDTIRTGTAWHGEVVDRKKDGTTFTADVTITPVRDPEGTLSHFIAIAQDVTQSKALEERLRHVQKMEAIGRLAGGVAHDFNNMLTVIIGRTDLALGSVPPDSPAAADLAVIRKATQRSARLTQQLLSFARRDFTRPEIVDISSHITSAVDMLSRVLGEDIVVRWTPDPEAWTVWMDPSHFDQLLTNLFLNARAAMPRGGHLTIVADNRVVDAAFCRNHADATPGDYLHVVVEDDGVGMAAAVLEHIFDPFFTTKAEGEGTGLGLATVYGSVTQIGGFIVVTSVPDRGSRFELYLPRHVAKEPAGTAVAVPAPTATSDHHGETILLVDDEKLVLAVASRSLEAMGYHVLAATSGAEALEVAARHPGAIHLLLTDVLMPGMNGRQLANALHLVRPATPVLYMSGYSANVFEQSGVLDSGTLLLEKPFSVQLLATRVRAVIDAAHGATP